MNRETEVPAIPPGADHRRTKALTSRRQRFIKLRLAGVGAPWHPGQLVSASQVITNVLPSATYVVANPRSQ